MCPNNFTVNPFRAGGKQGCKNHTNDTTTAMDCKGIKGIIHTQHFDNVAAELITQSSQEAGQNCTMRTHHVYSSAHGDQTS